MPLAEVPTYIVAQLVGGLVAARALWGVFGGFAIDTGMGATFVADQFSQWQGALAEVLGTFVLVTAIFGLAVDPRGIKALAGLG